MTEIDKASGLPLLGNASKSIPIDPKLIPDLRDADKAVTEIRSTGQMIGYQLVIMLGTAAALGPEAAAREKAYRDIINKVAALHGIAIETVKDIDLEKGVIVLK